MRVSTLLFAFLLVARTDALASSTVKVDGDAEIMSLLIALDENDVYAAATAEEKKVDGPVLILAQTIHQEHGKNIEDTKALGTKIGITPSETPDVVRLRAKGKQQMLKLIPLTGDAFNSAFVSEMVNGHREALQLLDQLIKRARNPELQGHLITWRQQVAMHLQKAESLQTSARL